MSGFWTLMRDGAGQGFTLAFFVGFALGFALAGAIWRAHIRRLTEALPAAEDIALLRKCVAEARASLERTAAKVRPQ
jgi:hypothetical protein